MMSDQQPTSNPPRLAWEDAPSQILAHCQNIHSSNAQQSLNPLLTIGITGPVGSGKTTLAARLTKHMPSLVLSTDDYLPDYDQLEPHEYDDPANADLSLLAQHLQQLRTEKPIDKPIWSFHSHSRVGYEQVHLPNASPSTRHDRLPVRLLIVEGIFALCSQIRAHLDCAIYIESPPADRWHRWKQLSTDAERGWSVDKAKDFFYAIADPTFHHSAPAYRARADYIVMNPTPT